MLLRLAPTPRRAATTVSWRRRPGLAALILAPAPQPAPQPAQPPAGAVAPGPAGTPVAQGGGTWRQISTAGAPSARWAHTAVWTGREMLVWGGSYLTVLTLGFPERGDGAAYNPATD